MVIRAPDFKQLAQWIQVLRSLMSMWLLQGRCWIEGDNAARSGDSRTLYGPVHLGLLEGRAVCIVWPPDRIRMLPRAEVKGKVIRTDL